MRCDHCSKPITDTTAVCLDCHAIDCMDVSRETAMHVKHMTREYLTTKEAAEMIRGHYRTLERWRMQGRGPAFIRVGRRIVYATSSVRAWMASKECPTNESPLTFCDELPLWVPGQEVIK